MSIGMGSAAVLVGDLVRLVRSFIVTCMGCLVVSVMCSASIARSTVF